MRGIVMVLFLAGCGSDAVSWRADAWVSVDAAGGRGGGGMAGNGGAGMPGGSAMPSSGGAGMTGAGGAGPGGAGVSGGVCSPAGTMCFGSGCCAGLRCRVLPGQALLGECATADACLAPGQFCGNGGGGGWACCGGVACVSGRCSAPRVDGGADARSTDAAGMHDAVSP